MIDGNRDVPDLRKNTTCSCDDEELSQNTQYYLCQGLELMFDLIISVWGSV